MQSSRKNGCFDLEFSFFLSITVFTAIGSFRSNATKVTEREYPGAFISSNKSQIFDFGCVRISIMNTFPQNRLMKRCSTEAFRMIKIASMHEDIIRENT